MQARKQMPPKNLKTHTSTRQATVAVRTTFVSLSVRHIATNTSSIVPYMFRQQQRQQPQRWSTCLHTKSGAQTRKNATRRRTEKHVGASISSVIYRRRLLLVVVHTVAAFSARGRKRSGWQHGAASKIRHETTAATRWHKRNAQQTTNISDCLVATCYAVIVCGKHLFPLVVVVCTLEQGGTSIHRMLLCKKPSISVRRHFGHYTQSELYARTRRLTVKTLPCSS